MTDEPIDEPDDRPEVERLRERGDTYLGALRILGREVRALRAKLEERS